MMQDVIYVVNLLNLNFITSLGLDQKDIPVRNSLRRAPWSIPYSPMKETTRGFFGEPFFCLDHCFIALWYMSSLVTLMLNVWDGSIFFSSDNRMADTLQNHIETKLLRILVHIRSHNKQNILQHTCCNVHGRRQRYWFAVHLCLCEDTIALSISIKA